MKTVKIEDLNKLFEDYNNLYNNEQIRSLELQTSSEEFDKSMKVRAKIQAKMELILDLKLQILVDNE